MGTLEFWVLTWGVIILTGYTCYLEIKIMSLSRRVFNLEKASQPIWKEETSEEREAKIRRIIMQSGGYGKKSQAQPPKEE